MIESKCVHFQSTNNCGNSDYPRNTNFVNLSIWKSTHSFYPPLSSKSDFKSADRDMDSCVGLVQPKTSPDKLATGSTPPYRRVNLNWL